MKKKIKYLVMDVDGTLTDGKIYMGNSGECMKAFSVKDGYVINYILKPAKIEPIVITARSSDIVKNRCNELGIEKIYQGKHDKLSTLIEIIGESELKYCAYFGDDILDLKCMNPIKDAGGIVGCPADAVKEVKAQSDYVCVNNAGEGALREFVEWMTQKRVSEEVLNERVTNALSYIKNLNVETLSFGKYKVDDKFYYIVQEYETKTLDECMYESHRKYVDIQFIVTGEEMMEVANVSSLIVEKEYDEELDVQFWKAPNHAMQMSLLEGSYIILYPEDAHRGAVTLSKKSNVKKIVGKVSTEE